MRHSFNKFARLLFLIATLAAASVPSLMAQGQEQTERETEVTIIKKLNAKARFGNLERKAIIDEKAFHELLKDKNNSFLNQLDVDFSRHTLIAVTVQGDCFVRATVSMARDDAAKKYLCRVTKIYGGCRAAGTFQSWILIEKIPPEYSIEFIELKGMKEW
jgi:hypothetical protein